MHKKNIMKKIIIIFLGVFCSIITKAQDIVSKYESTRKSQSTINLKVK